MKTNLFLDNNAILMEAESETIAIIGCKEGENQDISDKLKIAIIEHFVLEEDTEITLTTEDVLKGHGIAKFSGEWEEDGEPVMRDFEIFICATY